MRKSVLVLGISALLGCASNEGRDDGHATTAPVTGGPAGDAMSGTDGADDGAGSATTDASSGNDDDDGSVKFDTPNGDSDGHADDGADASGCQKVDFLFVIDNSGSMSDEQQNLIASFPGFMQTIQDTLDVAQDYHIMVIDTDAWPFQTCESLCSLGTPLCPTWAQFQCGQAPQCEDVLGAGVVHPKGQDASNQQCMAGGGRFLTSDDANLTQAFSCAAKVGTSSTTDPEKPMEAMVAAVTKTSPAGSCNSGFLRDDAILVVTIITDEDDDAGDGSNGTPEGWKQALVAAKGGDESAVVVLGLFGDNDQPTAICPPLDGNNGKGAEPSIRLRQFVDSFGTRGFAGSVCAPSYNDFFQQAVGIIDTTCDDFMPPG